MKIKLLTSLLAASLLLSVPSIVRIPRFMPFIKADVRAAAPKAMDELRSMGLWLVNVDMKSIERKGDDICFTWIHQYRSRSEVYESEDITTCIAS